MVRIISSSRLTPLLMGRFWFNCNRVFSGFGFILSNPRRVQDGLRYKTRENFNFSKKRQNGNFAEIVHAKTWKFSRSRMTKRISSLNSSCEN